MNGSLLRMRIHATAAAAVRGSALIALIAALTFAGCSDNYFVGIDPFVAGNLISNGSFEFNHSPSLKGWSIPGGDTAWVSFSRDVPPFGGSYSVSLLNQWTFPGTIDYRIDPKPGAHRYRLTARGKAVRTGGMRAGGEMMLFTLKGDDMLLAQSVHFSDTTWTKQELTVRVSSTEADAIVVRLRGNIDQFSWGYILFDLCGLELLGP